MSQPRTHARGQSRGSDNLGTGPPGTAERSPAEESVPDVDHGGGNVNVNLPPGADAAAMLRRRRQAAWRLGGRDPLDALAGLPVRPPQGCHGAEHGPGGWRPCCHRAAS